MSVIILSEENLVDNEKNSYVTVMCTFTLFFIFYFLKNEII